MAEALHRCAALQLVLADGDGFAFRHAMTRDVILAELPVPQRCLLSLSAAGALLAADGPGDDQMLRAGRLLAEGGEPLRAARVLLDAAERALAAGSLSSAELLLTEAGRAAAGSEDLQTAISGRAPRCCCRPAARPRRPARPCA